MENKFDESEAYRYIEIYKEWRKNSQDKKVADKIKEKLIEIEREYAYEAIAEVRQKYENLAEFELKMKIEQAKVNQEVEEFKGEKFGGFFSNLFGKKIDPNDKNAQKEVKRYQKRREKAYEEKYAEGLEDLNKLQIDLNLEMTPVDEPDYVLLWATAIIPKLKLILLSENSKINSEDQIMITKIEDIKAKVKFGDCIQGAEIFIGKIEVKDKIVKSKIFPYLTQTIFPPKYNSKEAIYINFLRNTTLDKGQIKIVLKSNAYQYVIANFKLISIVQDFFMMNGEGEDSIDISYYTEQAKIKAMEYISLGADYIETVAQEESTYQGIDIDVDLLTPIIMIPEGISEVLDMETIVLNLGRIKASSITRAFDKKKDYKEETSPHEIYDEYKLTFSGLQCWMIRELKDYVNWNTNRNTIDIIKKIKIDISAKRWLEQDHPIFEATEVIWNIRDIEIFFSDYIMVNLMKILENLSELDDTHKNIKKLENENQQSKIVDSFEASYTENSNSQLIENNFENDSEENDSNGDDSEEDEENDDEEESEDYEENEGGDKQIYMSSECQQTWEQLVSYADSSVYQDGGSSEENSQQDRDDLDSNDQDDNQDDDEDSKINSSDRQDDTESEAYNTEPPSISEFNNNLDDLNVIPNSKTKLK